MPATMKSDPELGPTIFVLFGATGDLAKRLVLPAFYRLAQEIGRASCRERVLRLV